MVAGCIEATRHEGPWPAGEHGGHFIVPPRFAKRIREPCTPPWKARHPSRVAVQRAGSTGEGAENGLKTCVGWETVVAEVPTGFDGLGVRRRMGEQDAPDGECRQGPIGTCPDQTFAAAMATKRGAYQLGMSFSSQLWTVGICQPSLKTWWTRDCWPSTRFQTTRRPM